MKQLWDRMREAGSERGNVLVGALLVLLVMTAMGTTYVAMTKTETQIAGHEKRHVQSMFNAEAGVGEALARMSRSQDPTVYFGEDLLAGDQVFEAAAGDGLLERDVVDLGGLDGLTRRGQGFLVILPRMSSSGLLPPPGWPPSPPPRPARPPPSSPPSRSPSPPPIGEPPAAPPFLAM